MLATSTEVPRNEPALRFAQKAVSYAEAVRTTWAPLRPEGGLNEVVRYAALAANSHNTQPWRFRLEERPRLTP